MITICCLLFKYILKVGNINQHVKSDVLFYSIKKNTNAAVLELQFVCYVFECEITCYHLAVKFQLFLGRIMQLNLNVGKFFFF